MRVEIIEGAARLFALEPVWWDLFRRSSSATPFQSPAWLLPWWTTFAPGRLSTVAVWSGDGLCALAPLYVEQGPEARRLLSIGIGVTDYLDVLVDAAEPDAGRALVDAVLSTAAGWDLWSIEDARPGATILGLPIPSGLARPVEPQCACPTLPLASTLRDTIPSAQFRKWRMARNRWARRGGTIEIATPETCAEQIEHLFRLHGARWKSRGEAGVLADDRVQSFHRCAVPALLKAGLLHSAILRIGDEVAGVYYGMRHNAGEYAYLSGFDPAFAFESPGTILFCWTIEDSAAQGIETLHFLRGQEPYKYEWGATDRWSSRRTVMAPR